jgi:hypothetical protein
MPQRPQLSWLLCGSAQKPPQHMYPARQARWQSPQWAGSESWVKQLPLHSSQPAGQASVQIP